METGMHDRIRPGLALPTDSRSRSRVGGALLVLVVVSVSIWTMLAIWHQVEPPVTWPSLAAAAAALAILRPNHPLKTHRRPPLTF